MRSLMAAGIAAVAVSLTVGLSMANSQVEGGFGECGSVISPTVFFPSANPVSYEECPGLLGARRQQVFVAGGVGLGVGAILIAAGAGAFGRIGRGDPGDDDPARSVADDRRIVGELERLAELRDSGALTDEQFEVAKTRLLGLEDDRR